MKHRGGSKIKYEHKMIKGLRQFLEERIAPLDFVEAIFPGEIKRAKSPLSGLRVRFQYPTNTGAKLLAYGSSAVQEVFVVTRNPEALKRSLESDLQETARKRVWKKAIKETF